ncbi:HEAT repeat domain-containing protein, partial [bacterium]
RRALKILGEIGDERAVEIIAPYLSSEFAPLRYAASEALEKIGTRKALR